MHKTTILCQFGLIICHQLTNPYLHQFSTIFGGNCITFEPLSIIADDDPVTCDAKENNLLGLEEWHRFRSLAKKDKVLARAIKQSKIRQVRRSQTYMFGYLIPRKYMEVMQFDSENKKSKWYDAIKMEMESM